MLCLLYLHPRSQGLFGRGREKALGTRVLCLLFFLFLLGVGVGVGGLEFLKNIPIVSKSIRVLTVLFYFSMPISHALVF